MITGTLTRNADARTFTASISTMMFDIARIAVVENAWKTADNHPDYHLEVRTPRGRTMRVGSMWKAVSEKSKRAYFSLAITGKIETLDDDNLSGVFGSYDFDMEFVAVENAHKSEDHHPDYHIEARSPAGVLIRMGSIWKAVSERSGNAYLSIAFSSPTGTQHRANGLRRDGDAAGAFEIVAFAGGDLSAVA